MVRQADLVAAKIHFDAPPQGQLLAKGGGLTHVSLGPKDATISFPTLAVTGQLARNRRDPAVQPVALGQNARVVIGVGGHHFGTADVIKPAGHQKAGETAAPRKPAFAGMFMQTWMAQARWPMPADRLALELDLANVHRAVDQDGETQASPGAKLQHPDAAFQPVGQLHQTHSAKCRQRPAVAGNLKPGQVFSE